MPIQHLDIAIAESQEMRVQPALEPARDRRGLTKAWESNTKDERRHLGSTKPIASVAFYAEVPVSEPG